MDKQRIEKQMLRLAKQAQASWRQALGISPDIKDKVLNDMAEALLANKSAILKANQKDVNALKHKGASLALIDRLTLNDKRIIGMAESLVELVKLDDPVGGVIKKWERPNGLGIEKVRTPLGVVAIIYEARPNVTSDCIGLCLKSGNSVILKGGSDAMQSNSAIFKILQVVLKKHNLPAGLINLVKIKERKATDILLKLNDYIDVVIPRGGEGLIRKVVSLSRIPVIKHYKGICHVYVDEEADLNMAENICFNAKVDRPGVCNAMESMLVHEHVAARFLPGMIKKLRDAGVEIRGCSVTQKIVKGIRRATDKDYRTEFLDLILSVKVVKDIEEAIRHINEYGSHHSDAIVTDNRGEAAKFLKNVDSACVYVNASTRFTDGYQFGMGAEIGISTDKLHARGPMALEELTTYKYIVFGNGQVRT